MIPKTGQNLLFLGTMQITNYLVPIITIPLLLERVGLEKYGVIAFSQGLAMIFVAVTDYGFNLTGTREVSQNLENKEQLRHVFSKIIQIRIFLILAGLVIFLAIISVTPSWREEFTVVFSSYSIVMSQVLFPVWYFQGIQKMYLMTIFNFASRIMYLTGLLFVIQAVEDYVYVNALNGISWFIWSLAGLFFVARDLGLPDLRPHWADLKNSLTENFKIFTSNALVSGYRGAPIIIASTVLAPGALGIFGVLDKIMSLIHSLAAIIFRSLFPETSHKGKSIDTTAALTYVNSFVKKLLILAVPSCLILSWYGPELLALLTDEVNPAEISSFFFLIALFPLLVVLNLRYSLPIIALDHKDIYFRYHVVGAVAMLFTGIILGQLFGITGLLTSVLITEMSMLVYGDRSVRKLRKA